MPEMNLVERYQAHRVRRFLANSEKWPHMLPGWRTRQRRRILVIALAATFALMLAVGVLCHFFERAPLLLLPVYTLFFAAWTALQIVSGCQGDAPSGTLDEWEIQQQNAARSTALTITQWLVLIPVTYLIVGSVVTEGTHTTMAYTGGVLTLTTLMMGGCSPAMILAWSRPDPDPESDEFPMEAA
ncbi:hypothetical protein O4215_11420 [Rhodococcus maanshanensis]|uniref:hypothetical protein n=1 Tax=Rhodococcus maanshanensis TaxID=183556 RepID=UPI0022B4EC2C|nr:hypothetical protein [Rhodococcus maanshanensis]MCZ4556183.1 hypothetical protein [Rhodococcus maanshanensis]